MDAHKIASFVKAAIEVRNAARASDSARTERARDILVERKFDVYVDDEAVVGDFPSSDGKGVYMLFIRKNGAHGCTCPDARKGNLCKHQRALAGFIIAENAKSKVKAQVASVLSSLVC